MKRMAALIRGINVGKAKRVGMAELRAAIESLGYTDVKTLLNSGNAVFSSRVSTAVAAAKIQGVIEKQLGVKARVTVLDASEVAEIMRRNPLEKVASNPSRYLIAVLMDPADASKIKKLANQDWGTDCIAIGKRAAYIWCPNGFLESELADTMLRSLGNAVTTRNWTTMSKLNAMLSDVR